MANKAIVYAIYPNSIQDEQCQKTFGCCKNGLPKSMDIRQIREKIFCKKSLPR